MEEIKKNDELEIFTIGNNTKTFKKNVNFALNEEQVKISNY